jgi:hypothetical protein
MFSVTEFLIYFFCLIAFFVFQDGQKPTPTHQAQPQMKSTSAKAGCSKEKDLH